MPNPECLTPVVRSGVRFFRFSGLASFPAVDHAVFTRHGGCSPAPFDSLNMAFGLGDADRCVERNRQRVARVLGGCELVFARQVHGTGVAVLSAENGDAAPAAGRPAPTGDALVTDRPGRFLVIQAADCQSVLLYDPRRQVVANVHSGWRGSVRNIIGRTIAAMIERFDCEPARMRAAVGPSLGPCCAQFVNYEKEIPRSLWCYKDGGAHFDFWSLSCDQLVQAGVSRRNIEICRLCTRCRTDLFFSYRGEGTTGRFAVVIGLKKQVGA